MQTLVHLETDAQMEEEGLRQRNALSSDVMRNHIRRANMKVYSARDRQGYSVLCMSVMPTNVCRHVVGMHNRPPTAEELKRLAEMLEPLGITLDYTPGLTA